MTDRNDIIEGSQAASARYGLVYTCKCGWIDLGHASPIGGAADLWRQIENETRKTSKDNSGYRVEYKQSMSTPRVLGMRFTMSEGGAFWIRKGLLPNEKKSVALAIFLEVTHAFESMQGSGIQSLKTSASSFSLEDLPSNILGFYRAVAPGPDYIRECVPVSKKASLAIWDSYGAVGSQKNQSTTKIKLFPCSECGTTRKAPEFVDFPPFLSTITPTAKGGPDPLWRDWDPVKDDGYRLPDPQRLPIGPKW